jgi:hypothetical protein
LQTATFIAGSEPTGLTLAQAVGLEVATAPLGSSSGGFIFTFDPATRGYRRTSGSFGPAFAERALTIGKGKFSGGFNLLHRTYDEFGGLDLASFDVFEFAGGALAAKTAEMELEAESDTLALFATVGVLNNWDLSVQVPYVRVSVSGTSRILTESGNELQRVLLNSSSTGIGDIAIFTKYRFKQFGAEPEAGAGSNGALAAAATIRLPTGDEEELRGLGVGRALFSFIASASFGRLSPHVNVGYEFWTKSVSVPRDFQGLATLSAKDQIHYAAGVEFEVRRDFTILADVLGRYQRGTGQVGYQPFDFPEQARVDRAIALVAEPNGVHSALVVPGFKWNFLRQGLLSVHAIVSLTQEGLRDRVTPVVGIDWGF